MTTTRTALITAAGRGMGAACARELTARGWRVALLSPSGGAERLAQELGGVGVTGSVTEPADLEHLVKAAMDAWGRIDGVVNNTGHPPKGTLLEIGDGEWHKALDLIILSVVRMARLVTPIMQRQKSGAIVNISTYAAFEPENIFPVSCTLRAGLGSLAKLYADKYAADGIRMNNLLPGFIDSLPQKADFLARIPMKRYGRVAEIAKATAFLLSEDSSYITGQNLRVDGGIARSV